MRQAAEENGRNKVEAIVKSKLSSPNHEHVRNSGDSQSHGKSREMYSLENKAGHDESFAESSSKSYTTIPLEKYLSARKSLLSIYRNKYNRDDSYLESYLVKRWEHENELFDQQIRPCSYFNSHKSGTCEWGLTEGGDSVSTAVTNSERAFIATATVAVTERPISTTSNVCDTFSVDADDDVHIECFDEKDKFKHSFSSP